MGLQERYIGTGIQILCWRSESTLVSTWCMSLPVPCEYILGPIMSTSGALRQPQWSKEIKRKILRNQLRLGLSSSVWQDVSSPPVREPASVFADWRRRFVTTINSWFGVKTKCHLLITSSMNGVNNTSTNVGGSSRRYSHALCAQSRHFVITFLAY